MDISRRMFPFYLGDSAKWYYVKTMQIVEYLVVLGDEMRVSSGDTPMLIIIIVCMYIKHFTPWRVYNFPIIPSDQINISNGNIKKYIYKEYKELDVLLKL